MPLTGKGEKIESKMKETYGAEKGKQVFYASRNAGTISGVDSSADRVRTYMDSVRRGDGNAVRNFHQDGKK
jgi:hypothetical protein